MPADLIDVDAPSDWPARLREQVDRLARQLRGSTSYTADLRPPEPEAHEIRQLLRGCHLRAYHATRLLDGEAEAIQEQGLLALTPDLIRQRIDRARAIGAIATPDLTELEQSTVFATGYQRDIREGLLWLFLGKATFADQGGLWRLLETWGGEGIYWNVPEGSGLERRLRAVGRPSVVVVDVPYHQEPTLRTSPGVVSVLVASLLGFDDVSAGAHLRGPVNPENVVDIWQPGHNCFERYLQWVGQ